MPLLSSCMAFIVTLLVFLLFIKAQTELISYRPLLLPYSKGPTLAGDEPIKVYATFYGNFTDPEKYAFKAFLSSLSSEKTLAKETPTVSKWWSLTRGYLDSYGRSVSQSVFLDGERVDSYSLGKSLKREDIVSVVESSIEIFPVTEKTIHLLLTAADVFVEGFCMNTCGQHSYIYPSVATNGKWLPYAWVGNPEFQCPGFCAWPYAKPQFGPPADHPLMAPNGVGVDGMIINLAKVLVGAATNPFGNAYYKGDASNALEAAGMCTGTFGHGAYPGNPGHLLVDEKLGASYNMEGVNEWKFMVPWIWDPVTLSCSGQPKADQPSDKVIRRMGAKRKNAFASDDG